MQSREQFAALSRLYYGCEEIFVDYLKSSRLYLGEFIHFAELYCQELMPIYLEVKIKYSYIIKPTILQDMPAYKSKSFDQFAPMTIKKHYSFPLEKGELDFEKVLESSKHNEVQKYYSKPYRVNVIFVTLDCYRRFEHQYYDLDAALNYGNSLGKLMAFVKDGSSLQQHLIDNCIPGLNSAKVLFSALNIHGHVIGMHKFLEKHDPIKIIAKNIANTMLDREMELRQFCVTLQIIFERGLDCQEISLKSDISNLRIRQNLVKSWVKCYKINSKNTVT